MKINKKELYLTPEAEVFEVKTEGVICGSVKELDDFTGGGDPLGL